MIARAAVRKTKEFLVLVKLLYHLRSASYGSIVFTTDTSLENIQSVTINTKLKKKNRGKPCPNKYANDNEFLHNYIYQGNFLVAKKNMPDMNIDGHLSPVSFS